MKTRTKNQSLEERFVRNLTRLIGDSRNTKRPRTILVALSGGPDSVALLHLLADARKKLRLTLRAAHVNYRLRGIESDEDEKHCRRVCRTLGLTLHVKRLRTGNLSKGNTQQAAREVRYRYFNELSAKHGIDYIATGHNRDDNVETVVMNLGRGAGTFGLGGISEKADRVIRPLIDFSREEIVDFLELRKIAYRTDSSNLTGKYLRNRVRTALIPEMSAAFGRDVSPNIHRAARIMSDQEQLLRELGGRILDQESRTTAMGKIVLDLDKLRLYHPLLRRIIVALCYERLTGSLRDFDYDSSERAIDLGRSQEGRVNLKSGVFAERSGNKVYIYQSVKPARQVRLKIPGRTAIRSLGVTISATKIKSADVRPKELSSGKNLRVYLDAAGCRLPFTVRTNRAGDRFQPLGMSGEKKLSDYFIDRKIDRPLREEIPIVTVGSTIAWVVGNAVSERFKISSSTRSVIKLEVEHHRGG